MPAQRSGAAPARSEPVRYPQRERLVDDDAVRVAAVGDAPEMLVGGVVGEGRRALAELLLALRGTRSMCGTSRPCSPPPRGHLP